MPKDRMLWEVQTLAANLDEIRLAQVRLWMENELGAEFTNEIIEQWEHELDEEDDLEIEGPVDALDQSGGI